MQFFYKGFDSILGKVTLLASREGLVKVYIGKEYLPFDSSYLPQAEILTRAQEQILEYLSEKRKDFNLPIHLVGSEFKKKVWAETQKIPFGEVTTYGQIAQNIENPKAARAVGLALKLNPLPLVIPCHRVIGANKKLVGFNLGLAMKEKLLQLETDTYNSAPTLSK